MSISTNNQIKATLASWEKLRDESGSDPKPTTERLITIRSQMGGIRLFLGHLTNNSHPEIPVIAKFQKSLPSAVDLMTVDRKKLIELLKISQLAK